MTNFNTHIQIELLSTQLDETIKNKINLKTKPLGSLGLLEDIAFQFSKIQNSLSPKIEKPCCLIFAGDHGICEEKVNPFPQEVTAQMLLNFAAGGAAINSFCNEMKIDIEVYDCGTLGENYPDNIINKRIGKCTKNFSIEPAMSEQEFQQAIANGREIAYEKHSQGYDLLMMGEMGIGNTTTSAALYSALIKQDPINFIGTGTGASQEILDLKNEAISKALETHRDLFTQPPFKILETLGGFEIATLCGAYIGAAEKGLPFIVDGFICTAAYLVAYLEFAQIKDYAIFAHASNEQAHAKVLAFLNAKPLLDLGLRLGEGTGAALCYPLIKNALAFFNNMASFESAGVSES